VKDVERLARLAGALLKSGGGLESSAGEKPVSREELVPILATHLSGAPTAPETLAAMALKIAEAALDRVASGTLPANLRDEEVSALEAIVLVSGRPAMGFVNGRVQRPPAIGANSTWRVLVATFGSEVNTVAASVGRITLNRPGEPAEILGTGWRVGANLVITNRHVAKDVMTDPLLPVDQWTAGSVHPSMITFNAAGSAFTLSAPAYVAADESIDFAVFRLQATAPIPPPLVTEFDEVVVGRMVARDGGTAFVGNPLYAIGHPWRPFYSSAVSSVFGTADGSIRWSPGYATRLDVAAPILEHDCSTLGGSSGSCMVSADSHAVVALHVGGRDVAELTGMGASNVALPLAGLLHRREGAILQDGTV